MAAIPNPLFIVHKVLERRRLYRSVADKAVRRKMAWSLFSNEVLNRPHVFRVEFMNTLDCNARCGFCSNHKMERASATAAPAVIDAVFRRCIEHGVPTINFLGGEALVDPGIAGLVRRFTEAGIAVGIGTNGTLLDRPRLEGLKAAGVVGFSITVHDADPARHDLQVGLPGAFESILVAIREARDLGIRIGLQTIYSPKMVASGAVGRIIDFARAHDLALKFNPIMPVGGAATEHIMLAPHQHAEMKALAYGDGRFSTHAIHAREPEICPMGRTFVAITPSGEMLPCYFMPLSFGNVRDTSFRDYLRYARGFPIFNREVAAGSCIVAESKRFFREVLAPLYQGGEANLPVNLRQHPEIEARLRQFRPSGE